MDYRTNMIFLDAHSTTPLDPQVLDAMMPYLQNSFGNSASQHSLGLQAKEAVEKARKIVARKINARPDQIFFTSGASESNNTVIKGLWSKVRRSNKDDLTIITSPIEHPSVLECVDFLCERDNKLWERQTSVDSKGHLSDFGEVLIQYSGLSTLLCSIQAANHEIGLINNIANIGYNCKRRGIFFHTDATQAIGKIPINVEEQCIDALSFSAHKIGGPKGVGVLYLRDHTKIDPLICGGLQESIRSGTLNVAGIVGLGKAIELLEQVNWVEIKNLRNRLLFLICRAYPDIVINGDMKQRLPNNLNISIPGIKSEVFVKGLDDVMISSGSACKSGNDKPSDILLTIGAKYPKCAIRFGLWKTNTQKDIEVASDKIIQIIKKIRSEKGENK